MNQTWWGNKTTLMALIVIMAVLMAAVGCNGFNPRGNGEDQDHPEELWGAIEGYLHVYGEFENMVLKVKAGSYMIQLQSGDFTWSQTGKYHYKKWKIGDETKASTWLGIPPGVVVVRIYHYDDLLAEVDTIGGHRTIEVKSGQVTQIGIIVVYV